MGVLLDLLVFQRFSRVCDNRVTYFLLPTSVRGQGAWGLQIPLFSKGFPLIRGRAVAVSAFGHPGARLAFCWICLFFQRFLRFCDNRVTYFLLPTPETLILPRFFNDSGGLFLLPTITGNGPLFLSSFHVI